MWEQLRRFSALPRPAKVLFLRAGVLLPLLAFSLRLSGFQKTKRRLQKFSSSTEPTAQSAEQMMQLTTRMVLAAARHSVFQTSCLERSLTLWCLLGKQGIASQLRIGVRAEEKKFAAHAWVECAGIALGEPEAPHLHYAAFSEEMSGEAS